MTDQQGLGDAVDRFRADIAAALTRSRRAAADARERSAAFRRESADTAVPARESAPRPAEPDDDDEDFSAGPVVFGR